MVKKWYCLNCRKFVDIYPDYFKGFSRTCKVCKRTRLIELEDMEEKDFKKLIKSFRKRTGRI